MSTGLLVFWLVMGGLAAAIASSKGHGFLVWWVYGTLIWPIALIHAIFVSPDQRALEQQAVMQGTGRQCPFCAEVVRAEAIVCKHCGRDLPQPESEVEMGKCSNCGWKIRSDQEQCYHCGIIFRAPPERV